MIARFASRRFLPRLIAAAILVAPPLLMAPPAHSAPRVVPTKLDPKLVRALRFGINGAWHKGPPRPGRAPVLIELDAPATPASLAALRRSGAELAEIDGRVLSYDRFVPADVEVALVRGMPVAAGGGAHRARDGPGAAPARSLRRADPPGRRARRPAGARLHDGLGRGDRRRRLAGRHLPPTFARGDAGYYDWIDFDHDGVLTPGVDAIDLNRNGKIDPGETVQALTAATYSDDTRMLVPARSPEFDP